jgi:hypothetical protein
MRIHPRDLAVGDVLALHDWSLHVIDVEHGSAVGVLTAEFDSCPIFFSPTSP